MTRQNPYDDPSFFEKYSRMDRSVKGLGGAGEWHELQKLLPDFQGKRVLDLGCGFGWHCRYAAEQGAAAVLGIDVSEKMLAAAREKTASPVVEYRRLPIEEADFPPESFDVVMSSLAFHYLPSFGPVCRMAYRCLPEGGDFVFSVEHPVFTAQGPQDWCRDGEGNPLHWPVDRYFEEGEREAVFLGETMVKYHRTLTTYLGTLLRTGFAVTDLVEPQPPESMRGLPGMEDERRRPMMLLVQAKKGGAKR